MIFPHQSFVDVSENFIKISNVPVRVAVRSIFYDALLARDNPMKVDVPQVQHLLSQRPFCLTAMRQDIQMLLVEWRNALLAASATSSKNDSMPASTTKGTAQNTAGYDDRGDDEDEATEPPTLDSTDNVARRKKPNDVGRLGQRSLLPILQIGSRLENALRRPSNPSSDSDDTPSTSLQRTVEMRVAVSSGSDSTGENFANPEDTLPLGESETAAEQDVDNDEEEEGSGPEHELGTIAPQPESTLKFACEKSPKPAGRRWNEQTPKASLRFRWGKEQISLLNHLVAKHRPSAPQDVIDWRRIYNDLPLVIRMYQTVKQVQTCFYNHNDFEMASNPKAKPQLLKRGWTHREEEAIRQGIAALGFGNWAEIRRQYQAELKDRTVDQISRKGSAMQGESSLRSGQKQPADTKSISDDGIGVQKLAGEIKDESSSESDSCALSTLVPFLASCPSENVSLINQLHGKGAPSTSPAKGTTGSATRRFRWASEQIQHLNELAATHRSGAWIDWEKVHECLPESLRNQQTVSQVKTCYFNHN
jgi:hypothetical protein